MGNGLQTFFPAMTQAISMDFRQWELGRGVFKHASTVFHNKQYLSHCCLTFCDPCNKSGAMHEM